MKEFLKQSKLPGVNGAGKFPVLYRQRVEHPVPFWLQALSWAGAICLCECRCRLFILLSVLHCNTIKRSTKDPEQIVPALKGEKAEAALCPWISLFMTELKNILFQAEFYAFVNKTRLGKGKIQPACCKVPDILEILAPTEGLADVFPS